MEEQVIEVGDSVFGIAVSPDEECIACRTYHGNLALFSPETEIRCLFLKVTKMYSVSLIFQTIEISSSGSDDCTTKNMECVYR